MNDKKRREAFKKILSDVIGVGIVFFIVFFFMKCELNIDQCYEKMIYQNRFCVCQNIWMKYIKLQKNLGQQFKRETQYKDLPPIFRIRPPKSTSVLEQREGASGLCELFNPTDDWWTFFVLASMLKCVGHVRLHVHPVGEGENKEKNSAVWYFQSYG